MLKYALILNENTKAVVVGDGSNITYYQSIGMKQMNVEQAWNGLWYLSGYAPSRPIDEARNDKRRENNDKCDDARNNKTFTVQINSVTLHFVTNTKTQSDLQMALSVVSAGGRIVWVDEIGTEFVFSTPEQIASILSKYSSVVTNVYQIWKMYDNRINTARTSDEVDAIVIDYEHPVRDSE